MAGESEKDMVARAKRGDHPAFNRLFQRYQRPVLSFLYGMTGRRDSTEDLFQETASRAFTLLPNLREESKFSTWLFGIARNVVRENRRQHLFEASRLDPDFCGIEALADSKPDPERDAIQRQIHRATRKGFAKLDEDRRIALALRVLGEKRYQEIAENTGWSLARVKIEIHRARLEMRPILGPFLK